MPAASPLHAVQYSHTIFNPFLYDSSFHGENQNEVFAYSQRLDGGFCSDLPLDDIAPAEPFPATTKQVTIFSPTSRDISGVRWVDKVPQDWVGSDVVDWLFDLAEKFGVSYEDLNINAFSNLSGMQLMRIPVEEFIHRDVKYGRAIHQAFQMVVATSGGPPHENAPIQPVHSSEIKIEDFGFFFSDCDDQNYRSNSNFESHATSGPMNVAQGPTSDNQGRCLNIEYPSEGLNQGFYCDIPGSSQAYNGHEPEVCPEDYDSISDEDRRTPIPKTPEVKLGKPVKRIKRLGDKNFGRLWEFIRDLLHNPLYCPNMVRWENVDEGVFRIVKSEQLAGLWGHIKNNPKMTYEKLSRAMRYYYKSRVFLPVLGRRLVYKFGPNAVNWRPADPNFENMRSQQSAANAGVPPLNQYEEYDIYH